MAEATVKWTMACTLKEEKEEIKRKRTEVRCTDARGFIKREHKVTPRSPRHTGFDTPPTALSWPPPAHQETDARRTAWSPSSLFALLTVIKKKGSVGCKYRVGEAAVTRGDLLNDQNERPRVNNIDPNNHKLSIDVFLQTQRRWS